MGSDWVGSLKRMTEIGRAGDMYWMLKRNWFQDNLVLTNFLVLGTTVCIENKYLYRYNDGIS